MPVPLYQAKAEFFRTIGHPARIRVLELLAERDRPVHELRAAIDRRGAEPLPPAGGAATHRPGDAAPRAGARWSTRSRCPAVTRPARERPRHPRDQDRRPGGPRRRHHPRASRSEHGGHPRRGAPPGARPARRGAATQPRPARDAAPPRADVVAGVTVGVVALPLALAFGIASGLGATAGLVTAVVAGTVAALFGGSHVQVSGPTGAMTVVLVPIVAEHGAEGVAVVGLMAGVLLVAMGAGGGRALRAFHPAAGHRGLHARHRGTDRAATGAGRAGHHGPARPRRRVGRGGGARLVHRTGPGRARAQRRGGGADPARAPGCAPGVPVALLAVVGATVVDASGRPAGGDDRRAAVAQLFTLTACRR